jgi:hypothetical protein
MSLVEPYMKGALFVSEVWGQGGWPAVGALYREPPASSEQVLHPREKFLDQRDPPVHIRFLPGHEPLRGRAPVATDVNGELGFRGYFKTWSDPDYATDAAGWGGDRYWLWDRPGGGLLALMATRWDGEAEAERFRAAYLRSLGARFPAEGLGSGIDGDVRLRRPDGTLIVVAARGRDVDVIDGARPAQVRGLLAALAAAERTPAGN